MRSFFSNFISSNRNLNRTRNGVLGLTAVSLTIAAYNNYKKGDNKQNSRVFIEKLKSEGGCLLSIDNKIYRIPNDFLAAHPGGEKVLQMVSGYDIRGVWDRDQYKFHRSSDNVKEYLDSFYCGNGKLPEPPSSVLEHMGSDSWFDPNTYIKHDQNNAEPYILDFGDGGVPKSFFVRNHGGYSAKPQDLNIKFGNGMEVTVNNYSLRKSPQHTLFLPIICAGAGRSQFFVKGNGTQWGEKGGDAIGAMLVKATSITELFESWSKSSGIAPILYDKEPCLLVITGSDNYKAVIHSSEFDRFYITTQMDDGSDLPDHHGRERRLVGKGVPGFRNIKSVVSLELIPEQPLEEVSRILMERLKDPMKMLTITERRILAACPKYDAYVSKDIETQKPFGFNLYFPISSVINETSHRDGVNRVKGIGFIGKSDEIIAKVIVCAHNKEKGEKCVEAKVSTPRKGADGRFVFWQAEIPRRDGDHLVTAQAIGSKGSQQLDQPVDNTRGLYRHQSIAEQEF